MSTNDAFSQFNRLVDTNDALNKSFALAHSTAENCVKDESHVTLSLI